MRTTFRDLLAAAPGPLVLPGAHDALSALLIEQAGFKAFFIGGFPVVGVRYGLPDIGLLGWEGVCRCLSRHPCSDATCRYWWTQTTATATHKNVVHVVHSLERIGAQALFFEDQVSPKRCGHIAGKALVEATEMESKIRAAAGERPIPDTFIIARTDAREVVGLDEALRRGERYLRAGADGLFIEAPVDRGDGADRQGLRRPAASQHARGRPHADPEAGGARGARLLHRDLRHLAADARNPHHAGDAVRYRAPARRSFAGRGCRSRSTRTSSASTGGPASRRHMADENWPWARIPSGSPRCAAVTQGRVGPATRASR